MSRGKMALIGVAVLVVAVIGYRLFSGNNGNGEKQEDKEAPPVPVTVVPVRQADVPVYLTALGTVQALKTVTVRPQVSGRLLELSFDEGGQVSKGQVLAKIDPATYQTQYDQAVARQRQDQAQLDTARGNLARSEELVKKNYISAQDLNALKNTVSQLQATVAADAASVRSAKIQLDYTSVESPLDGIAGLRQVDPGNVLSSNDAIVVLTKVKPINVLFTLPAKNIDRVRAAQAKAPLPVTALNATDQHALAEDGVLAVIDNRIDVNTGTFTLKAEFPNAKAELWPGQFVNVRMKVDTVDDGLVVPTQAVQRGPDGEFVYLLKADETVAMQPVTTIGEAGAANSLIGEGLSAGDVVVTEGQFRLKPGSKVKPMQPGEVPDLPTAEELKTAAEEQKQSGGGRGH